MLFSDIEGSTRLLTQLGAQYGEALSVQRSIMRDEVRTGMAPRSVPKETASSSSSPQQQMRQRALAAQRRLALHDWPDGAMVRVRMGLHTGQPTRLESDYVGMDVHRAARIASAAHGGQIVVSATTAQLIADQSPELQLKDLGWHRLKDIPEPERILQLVADELPQEFPALKSLGTPTNLPPAPTPIIGRDGELAEITAQFTDGAARLVTLTGPGGSGKTRLAIAAADRLGVSRPTASTSCRWQRRTPPMSCGAPLRRPWASSVKAERHQPSSNTSLSETCCWSWTTSSS